MRLFKSRAILAQLSSKELDDLEKDFQIYKSGQALPSHFGRDEFYDHMHTLPILKSEKVRHIHIADTHTNWPTGKLQYNKTSDTHLIYCHGAIDPSCHLLIAILAPQAHKKAKNNGIMFNLGKIAEAFRSQY